MRLPIYAQVVALSSLLLSGCAAAPPRDYCFSSSGDDSLGAGSAALPWKSVDKANGLSLRPGDRVLFRGGETFYGNLVLEQGASGRANRPIVVGSYGDGRAVIDAGQGTAVAVHNAEWVTVRDLTVVGGGREINDGAGIAFSNDLMFGTKLDHIGIENVDASGFQFEGILIRGMGRDGGRSGYRHVRVVDCVAHHNLHTGIFITGWWKKNATDFANQDVYIARCRATENSGDPDSPDENRSGSGIFVEASDGVTIEHCLADGNGRLCAGYRGGPVGIWAAVSRHVTFQFNKSADNHSAGDYDGGGFCFDGGVTDSVMQYNLSENNDGSGYGLFAFAGSPPTTRNVIRQNSSRSDGRRNGYAGIHLWDGGGGVRGIEIDHNAVEVAPTTGTTPRGVWLQTPTAGVRVHDNVMKSMAANVTVVEVVAGQKNLEWRGNRCEGASAASVVWEGHQFQGGDAWEHNLPRQ